MGNCTSRNSLQKEHPRPSQTCSSNQTSNEQRLNKLHIDTHSNEMDKILSSHLTIIESSVNPQQMTIDIHKNALNIAIQHHINAAYFQNPNYQRSKQMIYNV
jgi:hypothetical protein